MGAIPEIVEGLNVVMFVDNAFEMTERVCDIVDGIEVFGMEQSSTVSDFAMVAHSWGAS
jgi:hypothetical protein